MRSNPLMLTALLGLGVLVGAIVHFSRDRSGEEVAHAPRRATAVVSPFASNAPAMQASPSAHPGAHAGPAGVGRRRPESDADPADVPTAPADLPTYDESSGELTDEHKVPAERSGANAADTRATAVRELDPASPDSLSLLEQTLRSDPIARNRLLAVSSLRLYGMQAGNAERARAALRLALSDADPNVRTNAQDAYGQLAH